MEYSRSDQHEFIARRVEMNRQMVAETVMMLDNELFIGDLDEE